MASAIAELNQQNDSSLSFKSTRSPTAVNEKSKLAARKCNHFSIRGYVSKVRRRDPKLCYPFILKDSTDLRPELPPMVVPNFRWWRCISCVPEAKNGLLKDSCGAGNGKEAQNDVNTHASIFLVGQSSKVNNAYRVRNTAASTSTDSIDNKNYSPTSAVLKVKRKAHINDEIPLPSGCDNGSLKGCLTRRIPRQTLGQIEVDPSACNKADHRPRINQNGTTKALDKDYRAGRTEVGTSKGYVNHEVDYVTKSDSPTNCVAGIVSGSPSHSQGLLNLSDLIECKGEPSYETHNEAKVTINNCNNKFCENDDDYLGAERRKKPKVRLLSELLGLKKPQNPAKRKKKTLSSASSQDEYVKRKKVDSLDEGLKSLEFKKSVGTSEISESEYVSDFDDVSTEKICKALAKRHCKSKDPLLEKRNKIKVDHGDCSSLFRQKVKPKSSHGIGNCAEEMPQNLDFLTRLSEKNSVLTKKRGRVSQAQKAPTSLIHSIPRLPKECHSTQKDGEADPNCTENVRKTSENGHHFLSGYLIKENDQLCVPRKDGLYLSSSQTEQMLVAGNNVQKDKENRNVGEISVTFRPSTSNVPLTGYQFDGERNICRTAKLTEKENRTPKADGSTFLQHLPMQVFNSIANQKDLTNEVRGRIQDIDINSIPADDKTNEQGTADDIPMDVVELMAKNQYERHLDDPKDKHVIPRPPDLSGTYARQNGNDSYVQHMQNSEQSHFLAMKKPSLTHPIIPLFNENLGHNNNVGMRGLLRENLVSSRFLSSSQAQDHIRPYSARGLTPNRCNQNINAAHGHKYPPSFFQPVDSYQKQRGMTPRPPSITSHHHVWPSGMTSRMPLGITNPQMISQSSSAINEGRIHHQSSGSFLNFNASEKQQKLNFSNAYNSGNPKSSDRSSVDVNEAIPAMHLLSLMQNAAKIQNTDLSLGPQKVVVRPTSSRYPFSKNNCRTTAMQDNSRHPCYPTIHSYQLAYKNEGVNIGKISAGFMGHIPLTLQGQRNMENSHFGPPRWDHQPLRRPTVPPRDKGKDVASMSKPAYINNPVRVMTDSSNLQCSAVIRNEKTVSLPPDKVICQLNQNPSEFNDLKLIAQYMIGPENLRPRKIARNRSPHPRINSKRQNIKVKKPIPSIVTAKS